MFMTKEEIKNFRPYPAVRPSTDGGPLGRAKKRMKEAGVWSENQVLGRRNIIGCVALEITQRCNLDCTLCYLSEHSESTKDIPLEEVFRRIDQIYFHYGPGTDVQITGGDPTLRKKEELLAIVSKVREKNMNPTLMTNGKLATRDLLKKLRAAGLNDVAFHVDMTQERKGFNSEIELNKIREEYIERARGLGLFVIFNTTVFTQNIHEISDLVKFFKKNTDVIGMASFQLQADTGRGVIRQRDPNAISLESVTQKINDGAGTSISFEHVRIGHPHCHRYGLAFSVNGNLYDFFESSEFFDRFLALTVGLKFDRSHPVRTALGAVGWLVSSPKAWIPGFKFMFGKLWLMRKDIWKARGKVRKITFFMQNFMDASQLEADRIGACSFMVMTGEGPISMCMHNAKRDEFILAPVKLENEPGKLWDPLTGTLENFEALGSTNHREKEIPNSL